MTVLKLRFSERPQKFEKISQNKEKSLPILWPSHNILTLISMIKNFVFLVLTIMSHNKRVTDRSKCSHGHLLCMCLVGWLLPGALLKA